MPRFCNPISARSSTILPTLNSLPNHSVRTLFSNCPVSRVRLEHSWRWNKGERYTGGVVRHHPGHGERGRQRDRKWSIERAK